MPKKSLIPLEMVSIRLYEGDRDTLASFYPSVGHNAAIREIVHRHARLLKEKEARLQQPQQEQANDGSVIDLDGDDQPITVNG